MPPTVESCCAACKANAECESFAMGGSKRGESRREEKRREEQCWLLKGVTEVRVGVPERSFGCVKGPSPRVLPPGPAPPAPPTPPAPLACNYGMPSIAHSDPAGALRAVWGVGVVSKTEWCAHFGQHTANFFRATPTRRTGEAGPGAR